MRSAIASSNDLGSPTEATAHQVEQKKRYNSLFAAVVLAALDDAIADDKKYGKGSETIKNWARSRDGQQVLWCAGIEPSERVVTALVEFVEKGVRTSKALAIGTREVTDDQDEV